MEKWNYVMILYGVSRLIRHVCVYAINFFQFSVYSTSLQEPALFASLALIIQAGGRWALRVLLGLVSRAAKHVIGLDSVAGDLDNPLVEGRLALRCWAEHVEA